MSLSRSSSLSLNSFIGRHEELTESLANNQPRPVNPPNDVELSKEPMRPQARPARRNLLGLLQYSWLWEILAVLFSLVCVITIIVVLRYEDGRFLDQWNLKISVNAVVSFIGALAKSSFMLAIVEIISQLKWLHFQRQPQRLEDLNTYDESSRGPWGSVKLLALGYVDKKSLLASWAALVTIFALFVDPALQLVIVQPSKLAPSSQQPAPAFQVSQVYDPNDYPDDGHLTFYNGMDDTFFRRRSQLIPGKSVQCQCSNAVIHFGQCLRISNVPADALPNETVQLDGDDHVRRLRKLR